MKKSRQRDVWPLLAGVAVLGVLCVCGGCDARSSVEAAQTAVIAVQTVATDGQSVVVNAQTALPGAQATAQAGATLVSSAFAGSQVIVTTLQGLFSGATLDVHVTPDGAANDAATAVSINLTDVSGNVAQLDPTTREAAALAALTAASEYYPNASIMLVVVTSSGTPLIGGSKLPGQAASIQ